jgi:hypothetical protein
MVVLLYPSVNGEESWKRNVCIPHINETKSFLRGAIPRFKRSVDIGG